MATLFHLSGAPLEQGSVIQAGNWGRVLRLAGWSHSLALREMALEDARLARWPDRPSRLECAFVCITEQEARFYQAICARFHVLHEVELVHDEETVFQTSWELVNCEKSGVFRPNWCDAYWGGEAWKDIAGVVEPFAGVSAREGLTLSALRVIRPML